MASKIKYSEHDLQCAVAAYLDDLCEAGLLAWSHPPNEGKRKPQYAVKLKKEGLKAGEPDLIIYLRGGKVVFIELKIKGNYLSKTQKERHALLSMLEFSVYTVTAGTPREAMRQVHNILFSEGVRI